MVENLKKNHFNKSRICFRPLFDMCVAFQEHIFIEWRYGSRFKVDTLNQKSYLLSPLKNSDH